MKKRISTILIVLVFIIGLSIMLYPTFSNWYNERVNSYVVSTYDEEVAKISDVDYATMFEVARAYNATLTGSISSFVTGEAEGEDYIEALNVIDGMMGYLVIDKIEVNLAIYHGTDEGVLQRYVGHLEGTQLPTGDVGNNTVLTGHTGLPSADLLTDLTEMEIGDTFEVVIVDEVFTYEVFNISVVEPTEVDLLMPIEGKDVVTLVTCTPYGINSHRLLVQGEQIEVEDVVSTEVEEVEVTSLWSKIENNLPYIAMGVFIILLILALIREIRLRKVKKVIKQAIKEEKEDHKIKKLQRQYLKDRASYLRRQEKKEKKNRSKERLHHAKSKEQE